MKMEVPYQLLKSLVMTHPPGTTIDIDNDEDTEEECAGKGRMRIFHIAKIIRANSTHTEALTKCTDEECLHLTCSECVKKRKLISSDARAKGFRAHVVSKRGPVHLPCRNCGFALFVEPKKQELQTTPNAETPKSKSVKSSAKTTSPPTRESVRQQTNVRKKLEASNNDEIVSGQSYAQLKEESEGGPIASRNVQFVNLAESAEGKETDQEETTENA